MSLELPRIARNKAGSMFCGDFTVPQILLINLVHLQKSSLFKKTIDISKQA